MAFFQAPPVLDNQYDDDRVLRLALDRYAGSDIARALEPELREMGALAVGCLAELGDEAERDPPRHVAFDAYGRRIDRVIVSPAWYEALRVSAERGVVASAYESSYGDRARLHQWALLHLFAPSTATALCPLAMTDGVARTLLVHAPAELASRVAARLTSRDPERAWTSGQWMTEREGGSDVGRTSTVAQLDADGRWRLSGSKYFTSAVTADCALTLARPDPPDEPGSRALALFYVEVPHQVGRTDGVPSGIRVRRLKDKLGTKALPTAELDLDGCEATLIGETSGGVRRITTLLNIARFYNTGAAVSGIRRAVALARAYAAKREAYGHKLDALPLHRETLADMQATYAASAAVAARFADLLGKSEASTATEDETRLLRLLTPLAKLWTGKLAVEIASETLEAFGGAGYVEDTGLPRLLRDAQVLPIWEGTTNVLSLDTLRVIGGRDGQAALASLLADARAKATDATRKTAGNPSIARASEHVAAATSQLERRLAEATALSPEGWQRVARRLALSLARTYAAALLCDLGAHALTTHEDATLAHAAARFARRPLVELEMPPDDAETAALLA